MVIFHSYVSLPEGIPSYYHRNDLSLFPKNTGFSKWMMEKAIRKIPWSQSGAHLQDPTLSIQRIALQQILLEHFHTSYNFWHSWSPMRSVVLGRFGSLDMFCITVTSSGVAVSVCTCEHFCLPAPRVQGMTHTYIIYIYMIWYQQCDILYANNYKYIVYRLNHDQAFNPSPAVRSSMARTLCSDGIIHVFLTEVRQGNQQILGCWRLTRNGND